MLQKKKEFQVKPQEGLEEIEHTLTLELNPRMNAWYLESSITPGPHRW